jgi:GNAT superfamily N-acetyltransferase
MSLTVPDVVGLDVSFAERGAGLARSRGWAHEPRRWRFLLEFVTGWGMVAAGGRQEGTAQELLATCLLTRCTSEVSTIGFMLVAKPVEGRGLGTTLLRRALDRAGDGTVALAATRAGRPLYEKHGFRPIGELRMHRGLFGGRTDAPGHRRSAGQTRPMSESDLAAVIALDAEASGGDRTVLLGTFLRRFAVATRVLVDVDGRVKAFGAAWPSDGRVIVGPLLARDGASAVAVLDALASDVPGPARIDVRHLTGTSGHPEVVTWLLDNGFEQYSRTAVMVRGKGDLPGLSGLTISPIMQSTT